MLMLALCYVIFGAFAIWLLISKHRFDIARDSIKYRIHVNGIRGKSTVTRYTAAILRDAGIRTFGKTTGTAARVILPDGQDAIIQRNGYANVNEQLGMLRSFARRGAEAAVVECMAINPDYQEWLESKVMHSQIVVITNVRIDHQEEMGKELTDIARSLARSIPLNAILITAERQPEVLDIIEAEARRKGTQVIIAPTDRVATADLQAFGHVAHKENVAIGLAIAELFKIPAQRALASMAAAPADPGAFQVQSFEQAKKEVKWANLFAVNDKESFAEIAAGLAKKYKDHYRIAVLNNRHDRPSRVELFSQLAQQDLQADAIIALGDYEERVKKSVTSTKVATFGNNSPLAGADGSTLLDRILSLAEKQQVLLVGTVNIHTRQSEQILEHIAKLTGTVETNELAIYNPSQRISTRLQAILRQMDATSQAAASPVSGLGEESPRAI